MNIMINKYSQIHKNVGKSYSKINNIPNINARNSKKIIMGKVMQMKRTKISNMETLTAKKDRH